MYHCVGCDASFCLACLTRHRDEIFTQFDNIREQHDHLRSIYDHHKNLQEHPLFSQINTWEHDTIAKIQQLATAAPDELRQLLDERNVRMKRIFNEFNN
jgi:predicted HTH domain antitoxin